jgi:hypothetical protein
VGPGTRCVRKGKTCSTPDVGPADPTAGRPQAQRPRPGNPCVTEGRPRPATEPPRCCGTGKSVRTQPAVTRDREIGAHDKSPEGHHCKVGRRIPAGAPRGSARTEKSVRTVGPEDTLRGHPPEVGLGADGQPAQASR